VITSVNMDRMWLIYSATHRDGGIIDHIYIRGLHSVQSGVLPVYYSDHAAI
jgi:endonuclease/exonuclease/phosphatase (EEP) superfamily protein YafD